MARILIVDDEEVFRSGLKTFLTAKGYAVEAAPSGEEGVEEMKKFRPQLVLLDVRMPGIGGLDALPRMKNIDPSVRVIMVTAIHDIEIAQLAVERGADDYITKPVDMNYLQNSILIQHFNG
ncbi:MAG: response regulator [Nitrospinota bacterium]